MPYYVKENCKNNNTTTTNKNKQKTTKNDNKQTNKNVACLPYVLGWGEGGGRGGWKTAISQAHETYRGPVILPSSTPAPLPIMCIISASSVSQGRICTDNFTSCHTEIEVADPTFYLTQSHYTDTGFTSPSADPIMPGAWQGSHWSANF